MPQTAFPKLWPGVWVWLALAALALIDLAWLASTGHKVVFSRAFFLQVATSLGLVLLVLRYTNNRRLHAASKGLAFVLLAWPPCGFTIT